MHKAILITECLQNDFVMPIGNDDPLPNLLHVGYEEAKRLMGENPSEGPIARVMNWAYSQPNDLLHIIHIRDWHSPKDPGQINHLNRFGNHCLEESSGASFAFKEPKDGSRKVDIVNALSLNDFKGTSLEILLNPFIGHPIKVGLLGVWTEAKVAFLAYELATRYPEFSLGICSALTASSSRSQHFIALEQMEKILGVSIYSSVGRFIEFLGGKQEEMPLIGFNEKHPRIEFSDDLLDLPDCDKTLLRYLFRDCRFSRFSKLTGGFSGNLVLGTKSTDLYGHEQVPHVVKIGPIDQLGKERTAFERIEAVLGNNAPRITDFAELGSRGAIKYRYASMDGFSTTFQKLYKKDSNLDEILQVLSIVFSDQLGKLYSACTSEKCNLFEHYSFSSKWAPNVRKRVESILGTHATGPSYLLPGGRKTPNVCNFYEVALDEFPKNSVETVDFSYVHGDLNGANIIIDGRKNVWLIDFFHTHRGHILKDLLKLENDLLYIFTPINSQEELEQAFLMSDLIMNIENPFLPLPELPSSTLSAKQLQKAYSTVRFLRSFYPKLVKENRGILPVLVGQLRYAIHTLSFDESGDMQKKWALYTGSLCAEKITQYYSRRSG